VAVIKMPYAYYDLNLSLNFCGKEQP